MKVVVRSDAWHRIGTGHLMRYLTLADVLRKKGADVIFICRELPRNLCSFMWKYIGWFYLLLVLEHPSQEGSRL